MCARPIGPYWWLVNPYMTEEVKRHAACIRPGGFLIIDNQSYYGTHTTVLRTQHSVHTSL